MPGGGWNVSLSLPVPVQQVASVISPVFGFVWKRRLTIVMRSGAGFAPEPIRTFVT